MVKIAMNPASAQRYATQICNAADRLSIGKTVFFSGEVTVQGNSTAQDMFTDLSTSLRDIQQMVNRDVQAIHSVIDGFERMDEETKSAIEFPFLGGVSK